MQTLDKRFRDTFKISNGIEIEDRGDTQTYVLRNVFEDINAVLDFERILPKWESTDGAKPGIETAHLPFWTSFYVANQLMECPQIAVDLLEQHIYGWDTAGAVFNYFYYNNTGWYKDNISLASNNCLLPHNDPSYGYSSYIILVNLNQRPVRTCFWTFDGKRRTDSFEEQQELMNYANSIKEKDLENELKKGRLKKQEIIEYGFNEGIIYNGNRLHSPIIDDHWTRENPRCMFRIMHPGADFEDYVDSISE